MLALEVILDFDCYYCQKYMGVTLRCSGSGLRDRRALASTKVACPHCENFNHLLFSPDGILHQVAPLGKWEPSLEPSYN